MEKKLMFSIIAEGYEPFQMEYTGKSSPVELDDGTVIKAIDMYDFQDFIEEKHPYLKGKKWHVGTIEEN